MQQRVIRESQMQQEIYNNAWKTQLGKQWEEKQKKYS